jgi:hypothetical protein
MTRTQKTRGLSALAVTAALVATASAVGLYRLSATLAATTDAQETLATIGLMVVCGMIGATGLVLAPWLAVSAMDNHTGPRVRSHGA